MMLSRSFLARCILALHSVAWVEVSFLFPGFHWWIALFMILFWIALYFVSQMLLRAPSVVAPQIRLQERTVSNPVSPANISRTLFFTVPLIIGMLLFYIFHWDEHVFLGLGLLILAIESMPLVFPSHIAQHKNTLLLGLHVGFWLYIAIDNTINHIVRFNNISPHYNTAPRAYDWGNDVLSWAATLVMILEWVGFSRASYYLLQRPSIVRRILLAIMWLIFVVSVAMAVLAYMLQGLNGVGST